MCLLAKIQLIALENPFDDNAFKILTESLDQMESESEKMNKFACQQRDEEIKVRNNNTLKIIGMKKNIYKMREELYAANHSALFEQLAQLVAWANCF